MAFTYFFRDEQTLEAIRDHAIPALQGSRHVDVWDAGCAMGPEPYTLAIILRERMGNFGFRNVRIFASDIDETNTFGRIVGDGLYSEDETKRIPPDVFQRYFEPGDQSGRFRLVEEIRRAVAFQRHDLLSLAPFREGFGLVLCKNVLLHFSPAQRLDVIRMFHRVLVPGGFFATEHTQKLPQEVEGLFRRVTEPAQVFQKIG